MLACCCSVESFGHEASIAPLPNLHSDDTMLPGRWDDPWDFEAKLSRASANDKWGMRVEVLFDVGVYVVAVQADGDSAVSEYNRGAPAERQIQEYDVVLSVNGDWSVVGMSRLFSEGTKLSVLLRRPLVFDSTIMRGDQPLGMILRHIDNGRGLYVQELSLTSAFARSGAKTFVGDRIVKVNGRSGRSEDLLRELKRSLAPVVTIARA